MKASQLVKDFLALRNTLTHEEVYAFTKAALKNTPEFDLAIPLDDAQVEIYAHKHERINGWKIIQSTVGIPISIMLTDDVIYLSQEGHPLFMSFASAVEAIEQIMEARLGHNGKEVVPFETRSMRFDRNPDEKEIVEKFSKQYLHSVDLIATGQAPSVGDSYLLVSTPTPYKRLTYEEKQIALGMVQWFASPVGQGFLDSLGYQKAR